MKPLPVEVQARARALRALDLHAERSRRYRASRPKPLSAARRRAWEETRFLTEEEMQERKRVQWRAYARRRAGGGLRAHPRTRGRGRLWCRI